MEQAGQPAAEGTPAAAGTAEGTAAAAAGPGPVHRQTPPAPSGVSPPDGEQPPLPWRQAAPALARCTWRTASLLARRELLQPPDNVGMRIRFGDGTAAAVYRETRVDRPPPEAPAVLVVCFQLRWVSHEAGHAAFRLESNLNTLLFGGFPGLVSKLWLRHDQQRRYRGLYEWDGPALAVAYVRALWWPLSVVSAPASIHYRVLPGLRRDDVLLGRRQPAAPGDAEHAWWRVLEVEAPSG